MTMTHGTNIYFKSTAIYISSKMLLSKEDPEISEQEKEPIKHSKRILKQKSLIILKTDREEDKKIMKQKILIRVSMTDDKTRAKAMKTAVQFKGVSAVEIKGDHRNQIEVTGVEIDMIGLTNCLRKKVAFAELVSVNKVEPPKKPDEEKKDEKKPEEKKPDEKKPEEEKKPEPCCHPPWPYGYGVPSSYPHPCDPYGYNVRDYTGEPVYDHEPKCRIM